MICYLDFRPWHDWRQIHLSISVTVHLLEFSRAAVPRVLHKMVPKTTFVLNRILSQSSLDELEQETASGSTSVIQEQKAEAH